MTIKPAISTVYWFMYGYKPVRKPKQNFKHSVMCFIYINLNQV